MELGLTERIAEQKTMGVPTVKYPVNIDKVEYALFSEQYLERPYISDDPKIEATVTWCTVFGVPTIDDF